MKLKQIIPYKLKRLLPVLGLAGASLVTSCEKEEDIIPYKDIEIEFKQTALDAVCFKNQDGTIQINPVLEYYAADPEVRTIYLVPSYIWNNYHAEDITRLRKDVLEPVINSSPKFRGKGNFAFEYNQASKVPADSLWLVQQGWTVQR